MSHPFRMDFDKLATEIMTLAMGVGISNTQSHELVRVKMETICRDYACRAAGVVGNDADGIERLVWYRGDGWDHGGSAITWEEKAEELEKRAIAAEKRIGTIHEASVAEVNEWRWASIEAAIKRWEELDL